MELCLLFLPPFAPSWRWCSDPSTDSFTPLLRKQHRTFSLKRASLHGQGHAGLPRQLLGLCCMAGKYVLQALLGSARWNFTGFLRQLTFKGRAIARIVKPWFFTMEACVQSSSVMWYLWCDTGPDSGFFSCPPLPYTDLWSLPELSDSPDRPAPLRLSHN
jgi:hypothetical protein